MVFQLCLLLSTASVPMTVRAMEDVYRVSASVSSCLPACLSVCMGACLIAYQHLSDCPFACVSSCLHTCMCFSEYFCVHTPASIFDLVTFVVVLLFTFISVFSGVCYCFTNQTGVDCSLSSVDPPTLTSLKGGEICDTYVSNCLPLVIYGNNFVNSYNLTCHFTQIRVRATCVCLGGGKLF